MSAVFEWVGELLVELLVEVFGHVVFEGSGRILLHVLSVGRVSTRSRPARGGLSLPDDVTRATVSPDVAMFVGMLFWAVVALTIWWLV